MNPFAETREFKGKVYFIDNVDFKNDIDKTTGIYLFFHDNVRMKCYSRVRLPTIFEKSTPCKLGVSGSGKMYSPKDEE